MRTWCDAEMILDDVLAGSSGAAFGRTKGVRKIAEEFDVSPSTVQAISRPLDVSAGAVANPQHQPINVSARIPIGTKRCKKVGPGQLDRGPVAGAPFGFGSLGAGPSHNAVTAAPIERR
jgi:hypothetical protein